MLISLLGRYGAGCSVHQFRLSLEQGIEGGVVEGGVDVEAGIEEKKVLLALDELQSCGSGELEGVAAMGFEIKDVVCALGEPESICP